MEENRLRNATLLSWTLQVYKDFKLGRSQSKHENALSRSMQHHKEWWTEWEAFDSGRGEEDSSTTSRLIHIHHDAAVLAQVEAAEPKEIRTLYDAMLGKGSTEFESIHTLALGLSEEFVHARENSEGFNSTRYIERATRYAKEALSRPNLTRITKSKVY